MKIKATKTKEGVLLSGEIPPELASLSSAELFHLRDGAFLILPEGLLARPTAEKKREQAAPQLSEEEISLLRKLSLIKFENRTPAEVSQTLSSNEKKVLERLIERKLVEVFKGGKYSQSGVYNLSDKAFSIAKEYSLKKKEEEQQTKIPPSSPEHLQKFGWMVLETEAEARNFGNNFAAKVRSGEVMGQRGFDKRFYFVTKGFLESKEKEVLSAVGKSEKSTDEIARQVGIEPDGCLALLVHLCESGEVMEKKRGLFVKT
ncbi:MAG: hypothetical protein N3G22_04010 [Candidatus Micrarchaeota archaeon]|nr:hypothetical protein [Candidatus Micrarchaeota archaeon]